MKSRSFGPIAIHRIAEIERMSIAVDRFFVGATPEIVSRARCSLGPAFIEAASDSIVMSFHSFVVESAGKRVLIDTCHGNGKTRPGNIAYANGLQTDYLANLADAGFRPDEIDIVLCTHLHYDHIGWNTRLDGGRWVPTFPNARYIMAKTDFDHFSRVPQGSAEAHHSGAFADSVLPVVEAGQAELVPPDRIEGCDLADGLSLQGAPGHTPGSVILRIDNGFGRAVVSGDVIHHPIQILEPALHVEGEYDSAEATRTRGRLLESCADDGALLLPAHFPAPTAGRIARDPGGFRFDCEA